MKPGTFLEWRVEYMATRTKADAMLSKQLPDDLGHLMLESQQIEPLLWEAESHRAEAIRFYYQAKAHRRLGLIASNRPHSVIDSEVKAQCYAELWAREDAVGLCRVLDKRAMRVDHHIQRLSPR